MTVIKMSVMATASKVLTVTVAAIVLMCYACNSVGVSAEVLQTHASDNFLKFSRSLYQAEAIDEDVALGTAVITTRVTDNNVRPDAQIIYHVHDDHFRINNQGVIFVLKTLDADDNDGRYIFNVSAKDQGNPSRECSTIVYIHTKNSNDEVPKFTQQVYTPNVDENAGPNTLVTTVVASDKDGDKVEFGFVGGASESGQFVIEKMTGVIRLHNGPISLDKDKYELNVTAVDDGSCCAGGSRKRHTSTAVVVVFITDVNDNKPIFEECDSYHAKVEESAPNGSPVITVHASDKDKGVNGQVRYSIVQQPNQKGAKFSVDPETGEVTTNKVFDLEGEDGNFVAVNVKATDNGDPSLEGICSFAVQITDISNNPPLFDQQHELGLVASDNRNENHTTAVIHVKDVNDNPPMFDRPLYEAQITEEDDRGLPKIILTVTAADGNRDSFQNIVYFLTGQGIDVDNPDNSKFEVNRTSGVIYVRKPLDRDYPNGRPNWRFTVIAQDEGGTGLVGYADVQVNLKDINDNPPVFPQVVNYGSVLENGTQNTVVMTMTAEDYDDPNEGLNARLSYSIEKNVADEETGTLLFEIESETGVIKTAVCCLDREKTPDYSIQVVAVDGGGLKGTGTASIRVRDINDMPPKFTKEEWVIEVDETEGSVLPDQTILTVTVQDEDETNKFHYKVIEPSGFGADKFTMVRNNDGTGSLKIVQPLDYEDPMQRSGFRFKIQVNDKGEDNDAEKYHVAYSWVKVELRDINDNKPQFLKANIEVPMFESVEVGRSLVTFKATDPDQGGQSKVSYAIDRSSDRRRQFVIDSSGTVKIQRALDREENPRHFVKILAIDDGLPDKTATATLTVTVHDINDNAPRFLNDYRPVLPENQSPKKIVEILATDDDDRSKGNGPPFHFRMDSTASDEIRASFKVEHIPKGTNGDGMAIISSLRTFDREVQKEYHVPIVIKDAGTPQMTGTSTLTIIIGDENDNKMQPGSKGIFVYNYRGKANASSETPIGKAYVYDMDDWDFPDKKFNWTGHKHPNFTINEDDGMISMKRGTPEGSYFISFHVYDRMHEQTDIAANVTIRVKDIPEIAVVNSGSVRIANMADENFIRIWDYRQQRTVKSKYELFREKIASLVGVPLENVDVFSVQLYQNRPPITDVRFSVYVSSYYQPVKLNGLVLQYRTEIESELGINIAMVGIDECLYENIACEGSCTNELAISSLPYLVNANKTSLVGVRTQTIPKCTCDARNFSQEESCRPSPCLNGGRCLTSKSGVRCRCPDGYNGPRCQVTTRSFRGTGYAWFPALAMCDNSHISLEFLTRRPEGLLLYNGPITQPKTNDIIVSDFISIELENGRPRLLIDFGSGTLELKVNTKSNLNDGNWHQIDVFWDTNNVRIDVDHCLGAEVIEPEDGSDPIFDSSGCQATGPVPRFNEYLNVNAPLQLGGLAHEQPDSAAYGWSHVPHGRPFMGCIRNLMVNSELYDLARPGMFRGTQVGCPQLEDACRDNAVIANCEPNGICTGSIPHPVCKCKPGWTGPSCEEQTNSSYFETQSYVKYALSFKPNAFSTEIQLRFRTWQEYGELFRISDQHNREYGILEIKDGNLRFRYNLNSLRTEEHDLWLSAVTVNDGHWHSVIVERHGSTAILMLDGGEGRRYNETVEFSGHMLMDVDKQEGVYAGGKAENSRTRTMEFRNDYKFGCLSDIRLDGNSLPLPPGLNDTQWSRVDSFENVNSNGSSTDQCSNISCSTPLVSTSGGSCRNNDLIFNPLTQLHTPLLLVLLLLL